MPKSLLKRDAIDKRRFINFLRGIAIFLMLLGHCVQYCRGGQFDFFENTGFKIIYSFHMPLFMLISGYLFFFSAQKRDLTELLKHKLETLLYPIVMCSLLNMFITTAVYCIVRREFASLLGGVNLGSLWFLWSVLAGSIALSIAVKPFKNVFVQCLLVIAGIAFAAVLPCWDMNIYMYPYFVIGYVYARNEKKLSKAFDIAAAISTVIFVIMLFFFKKKHYIYTTGLFGGDGIVDSVKIDLFRWAIGLFGSVCVIWICRFLFMFISGKKLAGYTESLGRDSLAVYALSVSLLSWWLPKIAKRLLALLPWIQWNSYMWLYNLVVTPAIAIAYSVFLMFVIRMMRRFKVYQLVFGRM